jgi:addiction module HigA family antidote
MSKKKHFISPIHPGEVLKEEFLDPMGISQRAFARKIDVPANRVNQIVNGKRGITGDTAIRFGLALGTSPEMWLRLQSRYELEKAQDESDPDLEEKINGNQLN